MRRVVAAGVIAMLAACGGGGGGGGGTTTPPPGGGGGVTGYYLSGPSGISTRGLTLTGVDPTTAGKISIPSDFLYSTNLGTLAQWTATGGTATMVGTRFRVWTGTDGVIYSTDLGITSSSTAPTTTALSTYPATSICPGTTPTVLNDLANPTNSAVVFRDAAGCSAGPTDKFVTVPLSANAGTPAPTASLNEPVAVARDATGAITKVLFLIHSTPAAVGWANSFTATPNVLAATAGSGINTSGGDFTSLAVVPQADGSLVWVYRDLNQIFEVNLKTLGAPVSVFSAADNDVIQLPAVVDGTNVFVAMTDNTNPAPNTNPVAYTCQLVRIDTRAPFVAPPAANASGQFVLQENTLGSGLRLVGVVGTQLIYFNDNVSGGAGTVQLESVTKSATSLFYPASVVSIAAATVPSTFGDPSFSGNFAALTVSGGVYYTIATPSMTVGSLSSVQAYFYSGTGSPSAIGSGNSALLGGVIASPIATANPQSPAYSSAILVLLPMGGGLANAAITGYDSGGMPGATLGNLATLTNGDFYNGVALSEGPLQAGMPALVIVSGDHNGNPAQDLFEITPGTAASLHQVTTNLQ